LILQNSPTYFHVGYLSTLLGLKSEFQIPFLQLCRPRLEQVKLTEASKASPDLDPLKLRSTRSPLSLTTTVIYVEPAFSASRKLAPTVANLLQHNNRSHVYR
jgi:hypothetical protein